MSYAAPFAYATKATYPNPYAPISAPPVRQRRRRTGGAVTLPALRSGRAAPARAALAPGPAGSR
jgi:hypothetical protein